MTAPARKLILGIEGGATKTDWVLLEETSSGVTSLHEGKLPASNLQLIDDARLLQIFQQMPADATHVGAFLAGCASDEDRKRLARLAAASWPLAQVALGSDRDSSLAAAFEEGDGISVIAGTGAAITGRRGGRIEVSGGRGHLLGDRGGGYALSVEVLRSALSLYDLDQQITPACRDILCALALNSLDDLVVWAQAADKMMIAALAPVIFSAAWRSDSTVMEAIRAGARALADYTEAVARRLEFKAPPVRLSGSLFSRQPLYVDLYRKALALLVPDADVQVCRRSGAMGAAWLAARAGFGIETVGALNLESGIAELAAALTEQRNPRSTHLDSLSTGELIDLFVNEEVQVAEALRSCREPLQQAVEMVAQSLQNGGRLFYVGAGTSGRLGVLDASEIPPTFGADSSLVQGIIAGGAMALHRSVEGAEDHPAQGALAIVSRGVKKGDVVCGITASGRTPFVLGALRQARESGAQTILLSCNPARQLAVPGWDVEIDLPTGPEIVTGSTRLKAGTATKVALNILSTGAMIRLGKVRGNLMVDLNTSNAKLRDRAVRLVSAVRGLPYADACALLERSGWNVRKAIGEQAET